MQRGGLARTRRAADVKKTGHRCVGPGNGLSSPRPVVLGQPQLVERNRLAGRQDAHHHVFRAAADGMVATRNSMSSGPYLRSTILPSCGLRFFDIQVPDFQARDHGLAEMRRNFNIGMEPKPSMRKRMPVLATPGMGSMWMSEAFWW